MGKGNMLLARLDVWAVDEGITHVLEIEQANRSASQFYDFSDELCNLSCMAGEMANELSGILYHLELNFPNRRPRFYYGDGDLLSGAYWFNSASALVADSDFAHLLIAEDVVYSEYDLEDGEKTQKYYRNKRLGALSALSRPQTEYITVIVLGFLTKYRKLLRTAEMVIGVMDGLEIFFTPAVDKQGAVKLHPSAWV